MRYVLVSASVLMGAFAIGCGPGTMMDASTEGGGPDTVVMVDTGGGTDARTDAGTDARVDARVDAGTSLAGRTCTGDEMCGTDGTLTCQAFGLRNNICSATCANNTSQPMEQAQCGGNQSTCLSFGDTGDGLCTRQCTAAATTGCQPDQVCTGGWYTRMAGPDRVGCFPFCHEDAECPMGQRCNRFGTCAAMVAPMTNAPDGAPCNPTMDPMMPMPSRQCRGICFRVGMNTAQGICGSRIDIARPPMMDSMGNAACHDGDPLVAPRGQTGDLLGLCIFRDCPDGCGCGPGTMGWGCFENMGGARLCAYPATGLTAVATCTPDGGTTDAAADVPVVPDVAVPDVGVDVPVDLGVGG